MNIEKEYRKYLFDHINNVKKAYGWIEKNLPEYIFKNLDIYHHDESKYTVEEFDAYMHYFYGDKTSYNRSKFLEAWNHHQKHNPHHWQYWVLIDDDKKITCLDMPLTYIIEMISDWWSFSWKKDNLYEIFDWYKNNQNNMILAKNTRKIVEEILIKIKTKLDEEEDNG